MRSTTSFRSPLLAVSVACLLAPLGLSAQNGIRQGFWMEGATGTGTVRNGCSSCADVTVAFGPARHLRVGGAIARRVLVGLELFSLHSDGLVFSPGANPVDAENDAVVPVVMWYVGGQSGFFLRAGAGLARGTFTVQTDDEGPVTTERRGSALTFGVGVDVPLGRYLALTVNLSTFATAIGDVVVDDTVVDDVIATVYEAGFGLTLR